MRSMSTETLKTIYFQGILPSVLYGILIWGCSNLSNINTIHIRAARFIMKIKKNTSDAEVLRIANWKPMEFYYKKSIACKCYKIYNNLSPPLLQTLIEKSETRLTRNQFKLDVPRYRYARFKKSFTYRAPNVWNNLPNATREKSSFDLFKKWLKESDLSKIKFGMSGTGRSAYNNEYIYY